MSEETEKKLKDELPDTESCSLLEAWKITPAGQSGIDAIYILKDRHWSCAMSQVEFSLEQQMETEDGSGNHERPWDQIKTTIEGVLLTPDQWAFLLAENE